MTFSFRLVASKSLQVTLQLALEGAGLPVEVHGRTFVDRLIAITARGNVNPQATAPVHNRSAALPGSNVRPGVTHRSHLVFLAGQWAKRGVALE